ncbi:MAG: DUF4124 domain-containing protein [Gammaproteobacteria bacterium]
MNLAWKLLLAALVLGILLPFTLLKDEAGSTLLKFSELKWPDWGKALKTLPKSVGSSDAGGESSDSIYRWVDSEGNPQFSNSPPPEGIEFSVKIYDPDLNVIQSVNVKPDAEDAPVITPEVAPEKERAANEGTGSPYSADGIKKLFEDANKVEKLLNQRLQEQEAALGQ